jgi:hypothetical protein
MAVCVMFMLLFWVLASCSLIGQYQRFGETLCLHLRPDDGGSTRL